MAEHVHSHLVSTVRYTYIGQPLYELQALAAEEADAELALPQCQIRTLFELWCIQVMQGCNAAMHRGAGSVLAVGGADISTQA